MAIEVTCECGKVMKVPEEHAGKRGKCPGCGKVITVPMPASDAPTPEPDPAPPAVPPEPPPTEPDPTPPAAPEIDPGHAVQRLKELETQIPYTDEDELGPAKEIALGLAAVPGLVADAAGDMLARLKGRLDEHAQTAGEDDPHVNTLREMLAIATTLVEAK